MATLIFSRLSPEQSNELTKIYSLARLKVQALNSAHQEIKPDSSYFKSYFSAAKTINLWNSTQGSLQQWLLKGTGFEFNRPKIDYTGLVEAQFSISSSHLLTFAYNSPDRVPLIITTLEANVPLSHLFLENDKEALQSLLQMNNVLLFRGIKQDKGNEATLKAIFGDDVVVKVDKSEIKVIEKSYHDAQAKILKEKAEHERQRLMTLLLLQRSTQYQNTHHRSFGR